MESRATALYSDARQAGQWNAVFTVDQINGWLATQLTEKHAGQLPDGIRDPRVAISPNVLTLGFRTSPGGIETVASVDASVFLTEDGAVAIRLMSVRAGALPLPVMQVADELAAACRELSLPVRWTQEAGQPVAVVELHERSVDRQAAVPHRLHRAGRRAGVRGRPHGIARRECRGAERLRTAAHAKRCEVGAGNRAAIRNGRGQKLSRFTS